MNKLFSVQNREIYRDMARILQVFLGVSARKLMFDKAYKGCVRSCQYPDQGITGKK
jgi:hypothetical protein